MKWARGILLTVAGGVLVAQFFGYKIFGGPQVVENRPLLQQAETLVRLEAPNVVVTDKGRHLLPGIVFREDVLHFQTDSLPRLFNEIQPVKVLPDPSQPSGLAAEQRIVYWSGGTPPPQFLPPRLPKYRITDLGKFVRNSNLARESEPGSR